MKSDVRRSCGGRSRRQNERSSAAPESVRSSLTLRARCLSNLYDTVDLHVVDGLSHSRWPLHLDADRVSRCAQTKMQSRVRRRRIPHRGCHRPNLIAHSAPPRRCRRDCSSFQPVGRSTSCSTPVVVFCHSSAGVPSVRTDDVETTVAIEVGDSAAAMRSDGGAESCRVGRIAEVAAPVVDEQRYWAA